MQPITFNEHSSVAPVIIITFIIFGGLLLLFPYLNTKQIEKDCLEAVYKSKTYPLYQPEQALVEVCSRIGIKFKP